MSAFAFSPIPPSAVLGALLLVAALADPPMAAAGALCLLAAYGLALLGLAFYATKFSRFLPEVVTRDRVEPEFKLFD